MRWQDRIISQLMHLLDWSPVDKSLLIAGTTAVFILFVVLSFTPLLSDAEGAAYMNREYLALFMKTLLSMNIVWAAILIWGFAIRKRDPQNHAIVLATIVFYSGTFGYGSYSTGPLTSPYAGLVFVGGTFVAMLLFEIRDAMIGVTVGSLVIVGTTIAERFGYIPYAPLMAGAPYEDGRLSGAWLVAMGGAFLFIMIECIVLSVYIVKRWRDREEALAEAYVLLKDSKDQLIRAEALASLGSLVTGAAHELRNPLASSGSILQTLTDEIGQSATLSADDRQAALGMLQLALKGHGRAAAIVDRLYELAEHLEKAPSQIPVESVLTDVRRKYPAVEIACGPEAAVRLVDGRPVTTAVMNLLENAAQSESREPVRLTIRPRGNEIEIEVADTGRGIPEQLHASLFKPFATLQKAGEGHGAGLGLYIVHELVTRQGGNVTFDSAPGRGTTVRVRVPAA